MNPYREVIRLLGLSADMSREKNALIHLLLLHLANEFDATPDPVVHSNPFAEVLRRLDAYKHTAGYDRLRQAFGNRG